MFKTSWDRALLNSFQLRLATHLLVASYYLLGYKLSHVGWGCGVVGFVENKTIQPILAGI